MKRRIILATQSVLCIALFVATVHPQAVVPNPADITPVVNPPKPQTNIVISLGDYLTSGVSTYEAFKRAIDACRQQKAAKLVIPTGRYIFDDPRILQPDVNVHIGLYGLSDLEIDGQGSEFIFHHPRIGFGLSSNQRLLIRNLTVDWDINVASPGIVKKEPDGRTSIRIPDEYPANESTIWGHVSLYDVKNLKWKTGKANKETINSPQNVILIRPQTFVSPDFSRFVDGDEVVVRHYVYEGGAFNINQGNSDITLENITIYSCPGMGFGFFSAERGFRLSNCKILQRPGTQRLVSATADGSHFARTKGDIIVENCDFSGMGDDSINIHGNWMRVKNKLDQRTLILGAIGGSLSSAKAGYTLVQLGDELKFSNPQTLAERGRFRVVQLTYDQNADTYTVTVDRDLQNSVAVDDLVGDIDRNSPRFIVRNNYFHDHRARGMLIQSQNGLIENNRVKDVTYAGLHLTTDARTFFEGFGIENLIVRGNTLEGCNYAGPEVYAQGRHMAALNLIADVPSGLSNAPFHKNVLIEGNTIIDTPGLAILIASSDGVTLRNNTILRSNLLPFSTFHTGEAIDAKAQGSIMVTRASNVSIVGNRQLIDTQASDKGIYIDPRNTTGVTVQDNLERRLPLNSIDDAEVFVRQHYIDFLNREPDQDGWNYWTSQISKCGTDALCLNKQRVGVSAAYFIELEFQETGSFVYRFYKASLGRRPSFAEFMPDRSSLHAGITLEADKQAFANGWAQRPAFLQTYPSTMTNTDFVNKLFTTAGLTSANYAAQRQQLAKDMDGGKTRAQVLREVIEIAEFKQREFNAAFVLMQYYGYLRRDYDQSGYDFWLDVLNRQPQNFRGMVCAFLTSAEYQLRFGASVTRNDSICSSIGP